MCFGLALNMSRNFFQTHNVIMSKKGSFSWNFDPIFDNFYILRPYLYFKGGVLDFYKQATHSRPGDEPFFTLGSTVHDWGWPKNGPFWTKNGQTWQAY